MGKTKAAECWLLVSICIDCPNWGIFGSRRVNDGNSEKAACKMGNLFGCAWTLFCWLLLDIEDDEIEQSDLLSSSFYGTIDLFFTFLFYISFWSDLLGSLNCIYV